MSAPELESRGLIWTLGISSAKEIQSLEKHDKLENNYEGHVEVTDKDTLLALTNVLCDGPIKNRREDDHGVNDHRWELTIHPPGKKLGQVSAQKLILSESGEQTGPNSEKCIGPDGKCPPVFRKFQKDVDDESVVKVSTKVGELKALQVGSVVHLRYEMGSATNLFLVVLSAKIADANSSLRVVKDIVDVVADKQAMEGVPAFEITKDKQMDIFFPKFSSAFLGKPKNSTLLSLAYALADLERKIPFLLPWKHPGLGMSSFVLTPLKVLMNF